MNKRSEELKQLAIKHADTKEFTNLIELLMANGKTIRHAIATAYIHFPITSGKPSVNALVELENFASSRYKELNLARVRQAVTSIMNCHDADVLDGYLAVINMMSYEEVLQSAVKEAGADGSATDRS